MLSLINCYVFCFLCDHKNSMKTLHRHSRIPDKSSLLTIDKHARLAANILLFWLLSETFCNIKHSKHHWRAHKVFKGINTLLLTLHSCPSSPSFLPHPQNILSVTLVQFYFVTCALWSLFSSSCLTSCFVSFSSFLLRLRVLFAYKRKEGNQYPVLSHLRLS